MYPQQFLGLETVMCLISGASHLTSRLGQGILTILFFIRFGILAVGARTLWKEEEKNFICNSTQLLCPASCFDEFCPISSFNLFSLQLVVLLTHSLSVACYNRTEYKAKEGWLQAHCRGRKAQMKLHMLCLLSRLFIESLFIFIYFKVSGGLLHPEWTQCHSHLCEPFVTCMDLNSGIKNVFSLCLCAVSAFCGTICLVELVGTLRAFHQASSPSHTSKSYGKLHC
ncbi:gap junction beta-1 protein-like [Rhinophrynus dorsalis]